MINVFQCDNSPEYIKDFLDFPSKIYDKRTNTQDKKEEQLLIDRRHVLSHKFSFIPFVVYKNNEMAARAALTIYPKDTTAYIGYFESIDDTKIANSLFNTIDKYAKQHDITKITGPVNASFWIRYRLKIDHFDKPPYAGEPYNKQYYKRLFEKNGYKIAHKYLSNTYKNKIDPKEIQKIFSRYKTFKEHKYKITSPKPQDFSLILGYAYDMFIELYSDFPIFKKISKKDFLKYFDSYRYILDFSMVKMAYFQNKPVGFFIGLPDYGNLLFKGNNIFKIINIFFKKIRSKRYVMLYMGVRKAHQGLGKAIIATVIKNAFIRHSSYVGALIAEGKITADYGKGSIDEQYHYVILEKDI